ncbi:cellulose binding domain-containing protein [Luedemannella flava]
MPAVAAADTTPPSVPTNLRALVNCTLQVTLTWDASTDDVGVTGYDIYRSTLTGTPALIATAAATTFTEKIVGPAYYDVRARDAAGNVSAPSERRLVTFPPGCSPTPPATTAPGSPACSATAALNIWTGGFQGQVTVKNTGTNTTTSWTVTLSLPSGAIITQLWGGRTDSKASPYIIRNETYNGVLAPNASTTFGFVGTWTGGGGGTLATCTRTP